MEYANCVIKLFLIVFYADKVVGVMIVIIHIIY